LQWNEAELPLLQGTPLYERGVFECDSLRQFLEQLFPALSDAYPTHYPAESCTWDVFLWLGCLFDSRAFHSSAKDGSLVPSLLLMRVLRAMLNSLQRQHAAPANKVFTCGTFQPNLQTPALSFLSPTLVLQVQQRSQQRRAFAQLWLYHARQ